MRRFLVAAVLTLVTIVALAPPGFAQAPVPKVTISGLFDQVTSMGRNTYESLPAPLDGRVVIVISSKLARTSEIGGAVHFVRSLNDALKLAKFLPGEKVLIAGGVRLYEEAMKMPITLHLTLVHKDASNGYDAAIPNFNLNEFILNPSASLSFTPTTIYDTDPVTNISVPSHTYFTYTSKLLPAGE